MEINQQGKWLSILDYAQHREISISSIRRYIKAGRVKYKQENGKYFIWSASFQDAEVKPPENQKDLYRKLKILEEENQELRMLVDLYENQLGKKPREVELPEIPMH